MSVSALRSIVRRSRVPASWNDGSAAHAHHVVDVGVHLVVQPGDVHPPLDVHASVHARRPHVATHRQGHLPARALDLVGELDARRGRADDEHAALFELTGRAVLGRRDLRDAGGTAAATAGMCGDVAVPRREHDRRALATRPGRSRRRSRRRTAAAR